MASSPEKIDEIFNRTKEEKESGDVFDLSQVD
jgi:hypothetical protein